MFENSHLGHLEGIFLYAGGSAKAVKASGEIIEAGCNAAIKKGMGIPIAAFGTEESAPSWVWMAAIGLVILVAITVILVIIRSRR
jgi:hypothetical protein